MYQEKENSTLELKEHMTDSFIKTVSAYANYGSGRIVFGVTDDGVVVGINDPKELRQQIENKINDTLDPQPMFELRTVEIENKAVVELEVFKGKHTPYCYKHIAYKRSDTSSVAVDNRELQQLSLDGQSLSYDQLPATETNLAFSTLEKLLKNHVGLKQFNRDTLRTLGLVRNDQYTRAAQLLADANQIDQSSTIVVRFGKTRSQFMDRADLTHQSLLLQYEGALGMFDKWYKPYEAVVGFQRIERMQIPREAFREGLANALIHRRMDVNASVQIAMYEERIEITSPGGLPVGEGKNVKYRIKT